MPGPNVLIENKKDGSLMVLISACKFLADDEKFKVALPGFYVAIHPVTNAQYTRFLNNQKPKDAALEKWIRLDEDCFIRISGSGYETYSGNQSVVSLSI